MDEIGQIMKYDPVSGCKWTGKTTGKIACQLKRMGIRVSANTVGRLRRKQQLSHPTLEASTSSRFCQAFSPLRQSLPLFSGGVEMEPDRTPHVLFYQQ